MRPLLLAALAGLLALGACATRTPQPSSSLPPSGGYDSSQPERLNLTPVAFSQLPGWNEDNQAQVLPALRRSCDRILKLPPDRAVGSDGLGGTAADWSGPCGALRNLADYDQDGVRNYFESWFQPYRAANNGQSEGLFTGYYEAELRGSRRPGGRYTVPIYAKPRDLTVIDRDKAGVMSGGQLAPYPSRSQIEANGLAGRAEPLLWVDDPIDAFLLHIQGSGRVTLEDGSVMRVGYAGHNGYKFVGIGRLMLDRGLISPDDSGMPAIRAWLRGHPREAQGLMAENPRYVFFRQIQGDGPIGGEGVPLTPERSMAVDPKFIPYGVPLWLNTTDPAGRPLRRLMVAQDTGSAIKGPVRGDFFWGYGEQALAKAGHMKSRGEYYLLLPRSRSPRIS